MVTDDFSVKSWAGVIFFAGTIVLALWPVMPDELTIFSALSARVAAVLLICAAILAGVTRLLVVVL